MSREKQFDVDLESKHSSSEVPEDGATAAAQDKQEEVPPTTTPLALSKLAKIALVATLASAGFLNIASVQSAVILLPEISSDLDIPASRQQWVTSAYNIALGCALLFWGRLADIFGRRLVFLGGMCAIALWTLVLPWSPNEVAFDIFRALQGLSAAATTPSAVGILSTTFPTGKERSYAFITYTAASALGSVIGNILGGLIGSFLSWKWVFWIFAIISASVGMTAFFIIPRTGRQTSKPSGRRYFDVFGTFLVSTGLILLLFVLSEGNTVGWSTPWVPVLLVVAVALVGCFCFWERYIETKTERSPLVRLSLFSNLQFAAAFLVIMAFFAAYNSYLVFATFFFQDYQGLSALQTTLRFLPAGIAGMLICFVTARLIHNVPGYYLLLFASCCGIISPLLFAVPIPPSTTYWAYGFPAMCLCISADILAPTINLFVIRQLPQQDQALGGALIQTANQVGRALGLAIAVAVETGVAGANDAVGNPALLRGLRAGEWVNVGLASLAFVIILIFFRGLKKVGGTLSEK